LRGASKFLGGRDPVPLELMPPRSTILGKQLRAERGKIGISKPEKSAGGKRNQAEVS
jgi:hypothetical protein